MNDVTYGTIKYKKQKDNFIDTISNYIKKLIIQRLLQFLKSALK